MKWEAIVFDLDDTLYPERDYVLSGFRAVAQRAQHKVPLDEDQVYDELCDLFERGVRGNTFNIWIEQHGIEEAFLGDCIEIYRTHIPVISPFPEIHNLLQQISKKVKLGLISDGILSVQRKKWQALGLAPYFDAVTFSDQWGRPYWKPHIKPFMHTQDVLGVDNIIYVGDNPLKDFYGARKCGWGTIWLQLADSEYGNRLPPTPEYAPDLIINSLSYLEDILTRIP